MDLALQLAICLSELCWLDVGVICWNGNWERGAVMCPWDVGKCGNLSSHF